jgi:energy-converting hydrogenase Eha subunit C
VPDWLLVPLLFPGALFVGSAVYAAGVRWRRPIAKFSGLAILAGGLIALIVIVALALLLGGGD